MRKLVFNLHLYVALIAGVFIMILGLTGSIMAFESELDHILRWKLTYVSPQPRALSLVDISAIVTRAFPGEVIRSYGISTAPGFAYQVNTRQHVVTVNPYTGEILGSRSGPDWVATFLATVHQLHLRLLIRNTADTGRLIESLAGLSLMFLSMSGLYLWWPIKRIKVQWKGTSRRGWFDLHNSAGVCSALFLLVLSTTGVVIGFEEITTPAFFKITGSTPPSRPPRVSAVHAPDAQPLTPDQALEIARAALPGVAPFAIDMPLPEGTYFIRARFPEDLTGGGRSQIVVDQYTGKVLFAQGSRTAPAGVRMVNANRAIHTGEVFGVPTKILMSLVSLAAVLQVVTGVVMWWKRGNSR